MQKSTSTQVLEFIKLQAEYDYIKEKYPRTGNVIKAYISAVESGRIGMLSSNEGFGNDIDFDEFMNRRR